jgi:hypothetical protein
MTRSLLLSLPWFPPMPAAPALVPSPDRRDTTRRSDDYQVLVILVVVFAAV